MSVVISDWSKSHIIFGQSLHTQSFNYPYYIFHIHCMSYFHITYSIYIPHYIYETYMSAHAKSMWALHTSMWALHITYAYYMSCKVDVKIVLTSTSTLLMQSRCQHCSHWCVMQSRCEDCRCEHYVMQSRCQHCISHMRPTCLSCKVDAGECRAQTNRRTPLFVVEIHR